MRTILFFIFILLNFSFLGQSFIYQNEACDVDKYEVYRIDSINIYYLIYASKGPNLYKIVSKMDSINKIHNIYTGGEYFFHLTHSIKEVNYLDVKGEVLDDSTLIEIEPDSILFLSYPKNVSGLYIYKE